MKKSEFYSTPGGQLVLELGRQMRESIVVPNSYLPESYRNRKTGGRTLAQLDKICEKRNAPTPHLIEIAEMAKRIQAYSLQLEMNGSFVYDENERLLNEKIVNFCVRAVQVGMMEIDPEDFE